MKLVFATHNIHKLQEVQAMVGDSFELLSLNDLNYSEDIPEPFPTLEENALTKARTIHRLFHLDCFAEDTGLEIDALNGEPGVVSARYAGLHKNSEDNMQLVLSKLQHETNRKAQFRTVVALILDNQEYLFEGNVRGHIATEKSGLSGFGYDPIFVPDGYSQSFAVLSAEEKNKISHRYRAIEKLVAYLVNC